MDQLQPTTDRDPPLLFVSIGDADKLNTFLDKNPTIDRDQMLVDGYELSAYNAMGLKKFTDQDKEVVQRVKLTAPDLGGLGQWFSYLSSAGALAPVEKGSKDFPEGVLRLGATFVVQGNNVIYQHNDRLPGDHPDLDDVVAAVEKAQQGGVAISRP